MQAEIPHVEPTEEMFQEHPISNDIETAWTDFTPLTCKEVETLIQSCASKHCKLDHIPTYIIKLTKSGYLSALTSLINLSLLKGVFPNTFKQALVKPQLKKSTLDENQPKNYRPISNLVFFSKVLEKAVLQQYINYLETQQLNNSLQSAYKAQHSTETVMTCLFDDIYHALDQNSMILLVLLDYSAAFDLVSHEELLSKLKTNHNVRGTPLEWFASYLSGRRQSVQIEDVTSGELVSDCGVPQGSILGGRLFATYVEPLEKVMEKHAVSFHAYADDHQLYNVATLNNAQTVMQKIETCIADIHAWSNKNLLKLNPDKTEFMIISKPHIRSQCNLQLPVLDSFIQASNQVRDLGVIIDSEMDLSAHVREVCRKAWIALRRIKAIASYLDHESLKRAITWHVIPYLEYCSVVLFGLPACRLAPLEKVLNHAIRVIFRLPFGTPTTQYYKQLRWLKIPERIKYKLLTLVFKSMNCSTPTYLQSKISFYSPSRYLRSMQNTLLTEINTCNTFGDRAFSVAGPREWNKLPRNIRTATTISTFQHDLKTHFLSKY